jgi:hypothetical protein
MHPPRQIKLGVPIHRDSPAPTPASGWTASAYDISARYAAACSRVIAAALCVALGIDLRELLRGADEDVVRALGLES